MKTDAELMNEFFETNHYEPTVDWRDPKFAALAKYSPDQPREPNGEFGEGNGDDSLSKEEHAAVVKYTDSGYGPINRWLRTGKEAGDMEMKTRVRDALDSAISKSKLPTDMTLYRGVSDWKKALGVTSAKAAVGKTFTDKAFVSTSADEKMTLKMSGWGESNPATIVIKASKGSNALAPADRYEQEYILPRGSSFKVESIEKVSGSRLSKITVRLLHEKLSQLNMNGDDNLKFIWLPSDVLTKFDGPAEEGDVKKFKDTVLYKGAPDGHPFYGNQYTSGSGAGGAGGIDGSTPLMYGNANANVFIESHQDAALTNRMSMDQIQRLAEIYKSSEEQKGAYTKAVQDAAKAVGGTAIVAPLKGVPRAAQKIESDYNGQADRIKDILRSTIMLDDPSGATGVVDYFKQRYEMVGNTRNLLDPSANPIDGYRDAKMNIQVPGDHIGEVQVNVQEMLDAKAQAHSLYEERSAIERIPGDKSSEQLARINELNHEMKTKYYDPAWNAFLSKSKAAKSIAVPFRDTESSGNALGGDVSYASVRNPPDDVFNVDTGVPSTSQYMKPSSPSRFIKISDQIVKYAPDQARDKDGKFSADGGGDKPTMAELFSNGLGIARGDMPQIPSGVKEKFLAEQRADGVTVTRETVPARSLKPTQSEYNEENINYLREVIGSGKGLADNPILVSSDNRILDGHHRWAVEAEAGHDMPIIRVGLPLHELMTRAAQFNRENGIAARTKDTVDAKKLDLFDELEKLETFSGDLAKYSPDQPREPDGKFGSGDGEPNHAAILQAALKANGGFTYRPMNGDMPKTGYALSILQGHERVLEAGNVNEASIQSYLDDQGVKDALASDEGAHVGGWLDVESGKVYLDVSIIEHDKDKAIELAHTHNQEAIYDLAAGQTIITKDEKDRRKADTIRVSTGGFRKGYRYRDKPVVQGKSADEKVTTHPYLVALQKRLYKLAIDSAAHEAATSPLNSRKEPTDRMKSAGNYRKGHITINGLDIAIENPAGSRRKPQWPELNAHYGYVKGSLMESDGDQIDVFVKPQTDDEYNGPVFVIAQTKPDGSFDEYKAMIGWQSKKKAVDAYLENYTPNWKCGPVMMFTWQEFCAWVKSQPMPQ